MQTRTRTVLAWTLWAATVGCLAGGLATTLVQTRPLTAGVLVDGAANAFVFWLPFATVGLVLALRRPANPIGWLYQAAGLVWTVTVPWDPWVDQLLRDHRPLPPTAQLAALAADNLWALGIVLAVTLPLLLLPDGRLRSRRWRVAAAASVGGAIMSMVGWSLMPQPLTQTPVPVDKPFGLAGPAATVATVVYGLGTVLFWGSLPAAAVCVVLRFRASRGIERQQLRWVAAGAAGAVAGLAALPFAALGLLPAGDTIFSTLLLLLLLLSVPVTIAVAVLRYRLWDLDRLVSRTLTYALVTGALVLPYALILPVVSRLAGQAGSLAVAAATLAAAAAFAPLRRRVQDRVDRRFNRRRYDAARTVQAFATRLRDQVDLTALSAELLAVVEQTVQPTQTSLWLRSPVGPRPRP